MDEYNLNPEFKEYVDKYCLKAKITPEAATQHLIVKGVEEMYCHRRMDCLDNERRRY